ncbi:MAG: hypothetical protein C0171_05090, partial [Caldisphaera sp.]
MLYYSYGYNILSILKERGIQHIFKNYPLNLEVLQEAIGIIYMDKYFKEVAYKLFSIKDDSKWFLLERKKDNEDYYKYIIEYIYENANSDWQNLLKISLYHHQDILSDKDLTLLSDVFAKYIDPKPRQRQLLVDISYVAKIDCKTGIQRVVKGQLRFLLENPPEGYRVEPIYLENINGKWIYKYARKFTQSFLSINLTLEDEPIDLFEGDIFYTSDLYYQIYEASQQGIYDYMKMKGVKMVFLVHDILPILKPSYFPEESYRMHVNWINTIATYAD